MNDLRTAPPPVEPVTGHNSAAFAALPTAVHAAVVEAMQLACPGGTLLSVEPQQGGMSGASVYRLRVDDRSLLLRLPDAGAGPRDRARQLACLQIAAGSDVAPPLYYADAGSGITLSAFITPPAAPVPIGPAQLGQLLRDLHGGPPFPVHRTAFEAIDGALVPLAQNGVPLAPVLTEALAGYQQVKHVIGPHLTSSPCHNDLNPGNVLHDGTRPWLVDWDGACMNDPMFDVASALLWFRLADAAERDLLQAYFDRAPTVLEIAKLELMKHVVRCFYMLVFLLIALPDGGVGAMHAIDRATLPSFADFIVGVGRGERDLQDGDTRRLLSLVLGDAAVQIMRLATFTSALDTLRTPNREAGDPTR